MYSAPTTGGGVQKRDRDRTNGRQTHRQGPRVCVINTRGHRCQSWVSTPQSVELKAAILAIQKAPAGTKKLQLGVEAQILLFFATTIEHRLTLTNRYSMGSTSKYLVYPTLSTGSSSKLVIYRENASLNFLRPNFSRAGALCNYIQTSQKRQLPLDSRNPYLQA